MKIIEENGKRRTASRWEWEKTAEYQTLCEKCQSVKAQLLTKGMEYLQCISSVEDIIRAKVKVFEYAAGGNIHRGYYCPSPVMDLLIGNKSRGRKVSESAKKVRYRYAYDDDGKMLFVEHLQGANSVEYLFSQDDVRYGITVSIQNELVSISEEVFKNGVIERYTYATVYPDGDNYFCSDLRIEIYRRDEEGLKICEVEEFQPYINNLEKRSYIFERNNGFLTEYRCEESAMKLVNQLLPAPKYIVKMQRKA